MFYVGQKVVCIDDKFDPSIVEWADNIPCQGQTYTIRRISNAPDHATQQLGLGCMLLELPNPRTQQGGEVTFTLGRFTPYEKDSLWEVFERNHEIIEEDADKVAGQCTAYIGSRNDTGCLTGDEVSFMIDRLIQSGCVIQFFEKRPGRFEDRSEESLKVELVYPCFGALFEAVQSIRATLNQKAVGLLDQSGVYVRITDATFLCRGASYIIYGPSVKTSCGGGHNLEELGFQEHKDFWIATGVEECGEEIGSLPRLLAQQLAGWEAFSFDPADVAGVSKPDWIDAAIYIEGGYLLIWHRDTSAEGLTEPNIQCLSMR